jgi:hypothetical protein
VRFSTELDSMNHIQSAADRPAIEVPCVRLDDVCGDTAYAMGKMDIEGAELLALRGAESMLLANNPPVWLLEFSPCMHRYDTTEEQLVAFLRERGFVLSRYRPAERRLYRSLGADSWNGNWFAIAESAFSKVEARLREGA